MFAQIQLEPQTLTQRYPWISDIVAMLLTVSLVLIMVYWFRRPAGAGRGFAIHVDPEDITFSGKFPAQMQAAVIEFLQNDVRVNAPYEIRGTWEESGPNKILVVVVKGEAARPMEQRIRNFLKLNLKPPRN